MAILEVEHIEKHFGEIKVLNDISFSMEQGQARPLSVPPDPERQPFCDA